MAGKVEGVVGYPVTIPCDITPPTAEDSPHLLLWYKTMFGSPSYSVDFRNGLESASHWKDDKVFGRGVDSSIKKEEDGSITAFLTINSTKNSDAGPYRCRVDFWKAATRNYKIYLDLVQEVDAVNIYSEQGKLVTGKVVSGRVNASLALTCRSFGGRPLPSHSWQLNGVNTIQVNESRVEGDVVTSTLVLSRLGPEDSGRRYACAAANHRLRPSPQAQVTVEIILAPIRVEISRTASTFTADTAHNLTCQVLGSNPAPATALWAGGRQLPTVYERESADGKIFSIVASFRPTPADDNTFVICRAVNKYFPQEALEDQWKISVLYPPLPRIAHDRPPTSSSVSESPHLGQDTSLSATTAAAATMIVAREQERVVLSCRSESNPRPYEYHWRHNGASRSVLDSTGGGGLSSQLVLASVERTDSGNYSCLAENSQGIGQSATISLEIWFPPRCKDSGGPGGSEGVVFMAVHESADLACEMEANPANLTFTWHFETEDTNGNVVQLDIPSTQFTQHGLKSVLTLTPRTPADFGKVTCSAQNKLGSGTACSFLVNKKVLMPGVKNCEVTAREYIVIVACEAQNGQQQQGLIEQGFEYEAELVDSELQISTRLTATRPVFRFTNVRPGAAYTLNIYTTIGSDRRLKFSQVVYTEERPAMVAAAPPATSTTSLLEDEAMLERILPLVGVSGILIFAFIIIMIVVSLARRHPEDYKDSSSNDKSLHTHISFNRCLDPDFGPDILHPLKPGLQRVHSLDQLNQVSFEGFGSEGLKATLSAGKYNTLPVSSVSVISVLHHGNAASDANIVKRVTFAKETAGHHHSSDSSEDSVRTIREAGDYINILDDQEDKEYGFEESSLI